MQVHSSSYCYSCSSGSNEISISTNANRVYKYLKNECCPKFSGTDICECYMFITVQIQECIECVKIYQRPGTNVL